MLNSYRGNYLGISRHFDPQELTWFSDLLANARQLSEVVTIFMHHPLKTDRYSSSWGSQLITSNTDPDFFKLLKQYQDIIKYIFVGQGHHFQEDKLYGKIKVKETASLAEASSTFCKYPKYIIEVDFTSEDIDRDCK